MKQLIHAASAALMVLGMSQAAVADTYPSKPITIIVPFSPGGASDNVARPLAQAMSKVLNERVIVVNKVGAGGGIGMAFASKAAPDGYTLMLGLPSISSIPVTDKMTGKAPSYSTDQFEAIARITSDPTIVAIRADSKWKNFADFLKDAKAQPGKISYSSAGMYSVSHISMLRLTHAAGIDMLHVPYGGGGELIMALRGGQVELGSNTYGSLSQHIKTGKLRALIVQGTERLPELPDTPTTKDLGYDATYEFWAGLFAPAGLPADVKTKLRDTVRKVAADPEFAQALKGSGTVVRYLDAPEFEKFWREDEKGQIAVLNRIGQVK
jgi:tripartite-type tricarboxylate transporter receptor subunit TctC